MNILQNLKSANFTSEIKINKYKTNEQIYVPKVHDIFCIRAFVISNEYNLNKFDHLEIFIGRNLIWDIPFDLLVRLSSLEKTETETIITIPKYIFSNSQTFIGIPLYRLAFDDTNFVVRGDYGTKYSIIRRNTYCNNNNIRDNRDKECVEIINKYMSRSFNDQQKIYLDMYSGIKTSGFFIKTDKKLDLIKFKIEYDTLFSYDNFMINFVGKVIYKREWTEQHRKSLFKTLEKFIPHDVINIIDDYANSYKEYLYWIPFNPESAWYTNNYDYLIKMPCRNATIEFDKRYSGQIYFLYHNILTIKDGSAMLKYN